MSYYNDINAQMQALIRSVDVFDETINDGLVDIINEGADIILERQRALAPDASLISAIQKKPMVVSKKGRYQVRTGYDARRSAKAIAGIVKEFGRGRGEERPEGKERDVIDRRIGYVPPQSHIRKGFDETAEQAMEKTIGLLEEAIEKWGSTT